MAGSGAPSLGGDQLAVSVDDSGPGVPAELRHAIFERFRQLDGGTNRKVAGTGLGLAIAKEFVEMHRGAIDVVGLGSRRRAVYRHDSAGAIGDGRGAGRVPTRSTSARSKG